MVRNYRVPGSLKFRVYTKDGLVLQQAGVHGPLHHLCQAQAHQQPSVKGEPSPGRNDGQLPTIQGSTLSPRTEILVTGSSSIILILLSNVMNKGCILQAG